MEYDINYESFPTAHMADAIRRYVENGIHPGGFMEAVLCNDLKGAINRADEINRFALRDIVNWFIWEFPANLWGSNKAYMAHLMKFTSKGEDL